MGRLSVCAGILPQAVVLTSITVQGRKTMFVCWQFRYGWMLNHMLICSAHIQEQYTSMPVQRSCWTAWGRDFYAGQEVCEHIHSYTFYASLMSGNLLEYWYRVLSSILFKVLDADYLILWPVGAESWQTRTSWKCDTIFTLKNITTSRSS